MGSDIKPTEGREKGINTHTGSVEVAAPQSNTVSKEIQHGARMSVAQLCQAISKKSEDMRSMEPKPKPQLPISVSSSDVRGECTKCDKLKYVRCGNCVMFKKAKNDSECGTSQKTPRSTKWSKPSFMKNKLEGDNSTNGGRGTTFSKVGSKKIAGLSSLPIQSDTNIYFSTPFAGNVGRGENSNHTPTKRKLLETRPVHNLCLLYTSPSPRD